MFRKNLLRAYVVLVGMPLLLLALVLQSGSHLPAGVSGRVPIASEANAAPAPLNLVKLVLQIAVIVGLWRLVWSSGKFTNRRLRTNIRMIEGNLWLYFLAVMAVAIAGKFGGSTLAARMAGVPWRDSASL